MQSGTTANYSPSFIRVFCTASRRTGFRREPRPIASPVLRKFIRSAARNTHCEGFCVRLSLVKHLVSADRRIKMVAGAADRKTLVGGSNS